MRLHAAHAEADSVWGARVFDPPKSTNSHAVVIRAAAALGWNPGDDLIGILDVAGLAVHAIGRVQADALAIRGGRVVHHLVDVGWTEVLAGAAEFLDAALFANVGVVNHKMRGLIFFVLGAGMIEVGKLVESQLAVAFVET